MGKVKVQRFEDLAATWTANNPILPAGWEGIESDTGKWKAGDGLTRWNALAYVSSGAAIGVAVTGATQGSVLFAGAGGVLAQNNASFSWDDAAGKLKLVTTSESAPPDGAMELKFSGWNGSAYTHGLLITTTSSSAYAPSHIILRNTAYGTNAMISCASLNGIIFNSYNVSNARFVFGDQSWHAGYFSTEASLPALTLFTNAATKQGLKINLAAAQTADAFQVYASDGTTKQNAILSDGTVIGLAFRAKAPSVANYLDLAYNATQRKVILTDDSGYSNTAVDALNLYINKWTGLTDSGMLKFGTGTGVTSITPSVSVGFFASGVLCVGDGTGLGIKALLGGGASVASAAALPLPTGRVFHVTGTTNITSITSTNFQSGAVITLIFDGVLTFTNGGNINIGSNYVTAAGSAITLAYDGTNWYQVGRL